MSLKRGIDKAVGGDHRRAEDALEADQGSEGDRPGRHHLGQQRPDHRRDHRRGDEQGRQGRRDHGRGGEEPRDHARSGRGHAVRPRLPVAVLRHRSRQDGVRARGCLPADPREEDQRHEGPAAGARGDRAHRQAVHHHRRGRRGRGAGDAGGEQDPRHAALRGGEGAGLRRSPQGDARGHRDPHRRQGHRRRARHQARERDAQRPRPRQAHRHRQGQHDHRRRRRQEGRHRGPHQADPRPDRGDHLATTTARSCRSGWRSWSAAWR